MRFIALCTLACIQQLLLNNYTSLPPFLDGNSRCKFPELLILTFWFMDLFNVVYFSGSSQLESWGSSM